MIYLFVILSKIIKGANCALAVNRAGVVRIVIRYRAIGGRGERAVGGRGGE